MEIEISKIHNTRPSSAMVTELPHQTERLERMTQSRGIMGSCGDFECLLKPTTRQMRAKILFRMAWHVLQSCDGTGLDQSQLSPNQIIRQPKAPQPRSVPIRSTIWQNRARRGRTWRSFLGSGFYTPFDGATFQVAQELAAAEKEVMIFRTVGRPQETAVRLIRMLLSYITQVSAWHQALVSLALSRDPQDNRSPQVRRAVRTHFLLSFSRYMLLDESG
jgi:hypothetical protein